MNTISVERTFLTKDFFLNTWSDIEPYFNQLLERSILNVEELKKWLKDRSELEAFLEENAGWRYIKMSCDTANEEKRKSYEFFVSEIDPHVAPYTNLLNKKLVECKFANELTKSGYKILLRGIKKQIEIFREENIPLNTELATKSQEYGNIAGAMTVEHDAKELTMQQAAKMLKETDRGFRENIYKKIISRRQKDKDALNKLLDVLIEKRNQVALNSGFKNYRDYMFAAMGRFDYTAQDCFDFHEAIKTEILPLITLIDNKRKKELGYESLRPWDTEVDVSGKTTIAPFSDDKDLVNKTITCFNKLKPEFAKYIQTMNELGRLDLGSRKGKAPGGYNYPLYETGIPFIFMNAVGTQQDMVTMVHEGGHAVHSFLSRDLDLCDFKSVPSEVAELASMGMELISMEHWDAFYNDSTALKNAKMEQLEKVLETLPWVALIDKFQHWLYENPKHSHDERKIKWLEFYKEFSSPVLDWSGIESYRDYIWQKQLHIYEVPFYYIEYGMAQLGAIALWKNFNSNPTQTIEQYKQALCLGYTSGIPDLYKAAGIEFNFSKNYVSELAAFVKSEMLALETSN